MKGCKKMNCDIKREILRGQLANELTESVVYGRLAAMQKDEKNRGILENIGRDEAAHAKVISELLGESGAVNRLTVARVVFNARVFGLTFALKLMEKGENSASLTYKGIQDEYPQLVKIAEDEERHEAELLGLLNDERLNNMGSIVLGLNDALVELTGALAGFTFALSDPVKIAKTGLITGLAAAMSMAASAFLSARADSHANSDDAEESSGGAGKAALYTGIAYVITVFLLVAPYLVFTNVTCALIAMLLCALGVIAFFNFYLSVARDTSFKRGFFEMAGISTTVALISYGIGYLLK
jgi:VIT1/CCC1 family predicted Fe2+/Mn2+ transporter